MVVEHAPVTDGHGGTRHADHPCSMMSSASCATSSTSSAKASAIVSGSSPSCNLATARARGRSYGFAAVRVASHGRRVAQPTRPPRAPATSPWPSARSSGARRRHDRDGDDRRRRPARVRPTRTLPPSPVDETDESVRAALTTGIVNHAHRHPRPTVAHTVGLEGYLEGHTGQARLLAALSVVSFLITLALVRIELPSRSRRPPDTADTPRR